MIIKVFGFSTFLAVYIITSQGPFTLALDHRNKISMMKEGVEKNYSEAFSINEITNMENIHICQMLLSKASKSGGM